MNTLMNTLPAVPIRLISRLLLAGALLVLALLTVPFPAQSQAAQSQAVTPTPPGASSSGEQYIRASRLGITFISSAEQPADDTRYRRALLLGTGWNRYPLYWNRVETAPGSYNWGDYDRVIADDVRYGLRTNAILLGRPQFYQQGGGILGLDQPVFTDGSDTPAPGKTINSGNPWALFVWNAVSRYKPGGTLAAALGWGADQGVSVWEAWNEPDLDLFWNGSVAEYARLLKVTYLVVRLADPSARVLFGGLAYGNPDQNDWLDATLAVLAGDSGRVANNWYFDILPLHSYSYARRTALIINRARAVLRRYGLDKPVWINESGVPVWDDYPGPTWAVLDPASRALRATEQQAANFMIQSTAYAWAAGADVVFFHQLYDDCGNQPGGTTFPPHNGDLCAQLAICAGDAHGLFRNERTAACFNQHPLPGTPRPAAQAFRLLASLFGTAPFEAGTVLDVQARATVIAFERRVTGERLYVLWNASLEPLVLDLPASGTSAQLYGMETEYRLTPDAAGLYRITLPPAVRDDLPGLPPGEVSGIGGAPFVLVEQTGGAPLNPALLGLETPAETLAAPTATSAPVVLPRPTTDPALDDTPPEATVLPLPPVSPPTFAVSWRGRDDSGITRYIIWVRVNGGDWQPWLDTARTDAPYTGSPGNTYEFAVWALDLGGNWSSNVDLVPQAVTRVE